MSFLSIVNLKHYYGDRIILDIPRFTIYSGDKIGIVGANGVGKTTLLNILSGELTADIGKINSYCTISYIKQGGVESQQDAASNEFSVPKGQYSIDLSGGEKTRIRISNALYRPYTLLLADEPSVHLDQTGVEALINILKQIPSFVMVTHDRYLLEALCNKIVELRNGSLYEYDGDYNKYVHQKFIENESAWNEYNKYTEEKKRLNSIYEKKKKQATKSAKKPRGMSSSEQKMRDFTASKGFDTKTKGIERAAKAVYSKLENLQEVEKPKEPPKIKLDFTLTDPPSNKIVISSDSLTFGYDDIILQEASFAIKNRSRVAVVGKNGAGKTTLLQLIYNRHPDIYIVPKAKIGYFRQELDNLNLNETVLESAMQNSVHNTSVVRTVLARLLFNSQDINKRISVLSGGEKVKLGIANLLLSSCNVLLLDEPTNFLDIYSIEAIESVLKEYEGTLILVSHDKRLVKSVATEVLEIKNKKIVPAEDEYLLEPDGRGEIK